MNNADWYLFFCTGLLMAVTLPFAMAQNDLSAVLIFGGVGAVYFAASYVEAARNDD